VYRCRDPVYRKVLDALRTSVPGSGLMKQLTQRMAWRTRDPTVPAMRALLHSHPETTILTCTRKGAAEVNECALWALFPNHPPLVTLDADVESDPANYDRAQLRAMEDLRPSRLPIFTGMRVYLTRNVRKDIDFVNGMLATVVGYTARTGELRVRTQTGFVVSVFPWTDTDLGNMVYYPARAGYASTIIKFQGAELPHVTAFLDKPTIPGAAYTAMSRVGSGDRVLLAGLLTPDHFTPAR
jgi:hypothetical protein